MRKLSTLALATALAAVSLASFVPPAAADHNFGSCDPHNVAPNAGHAPANTWSNHAHPQWTWSINGACLVQVGYRVTQSWGGVTHHGTSSTSGSHHVNVPDGIQTIMVATQQQYCHFHSIFTPCHVHTDRYSANFPSAPVLIDTVPPAVWVADVSDAILVGGVIHLSSRSVITLGASDDRSGVAAVQYVSGGAWASASEGIRIEGDDGPGVLQFRALDQAGNLAQGALEYVLDKTAPSIEILTPVRNSAYVGPLSTETCDGPARVGFEGEQVAAVPDAPQLPAPELPATPAVPEPVAAGPAPCDGVIAKTNGISIVFPVAPEAPGVPELPVAPPGADDLPVNVPDVPETPETPELPADLPETPEVPSGVAVDPQDAGFQPFVVASGIVTFRALIEDALVGTGTVSFLVDGELVASVSGEGDGEYDFVWDTSGLATGEHTVVVRASDLLDNVGEISFLVLVVSGEPPSLEPPTPPEPEAPEVPATPELPPI